MDSKNIDTFKYNYIIAGGSGFYEVAYNDLKEYDDITYYKNYIGGIESKLMKFLIRLNFNLKVNQFVSTPLSSIVYPNLYPFKYTNNKPLCFIFFGTQFAVMNSSYLKYLRKKFPGVKLVLYMQDIVSSLPYYHMRNYKKQFDIIISYDRNDAEKYGVLYYPTPYSYCDVKDIDIEPFDVYFCGFAKTRYPTIFEAFRKCKAEGLKCKFIISGVPEAERIKHPDIIYDIHLSYQENLAYVKKCKCILEIMQENAVGFTPRLWESIFYNKHLLTNNKIITTSKYYDSERIHLYNPDNRVKDWIDFQLNINKDIITQKSPVKLLEFIEKNFS